MEGIDEIEYLIINDGSTDNTVEVATSSLYAVISFLTEKNALYHQSVVLLLLYQPFHPILIGLILGIRYLVFFFTGGAMGHVQSLILASTLMMLGCMTGIIFDTGIIFIKTNVLPLIKKLPAPR